MPCTYYKVYKEKCEKEDIPINHWAIPWELWKVMEEDKVAEKCGQMMKKQQQLLLHFKTITGPCEFTRVGILQAVMKLIVTNNKKSSKLLNMM